MEIRRRKKILDFMASGDAKARKLFPARLEDTEEAQWHNTMEVKASVVFQISLTVLRALRPQKGDHMIVFLCVSIKEIVEQGRDFPWPNGQSDTVFSLHLDNTFS